MDSENKGTAYNRLRGFRRAVPIILAAVGIFIAVCFFTEGAGALGYGVAALLKGLFSAGAYAIPALLVIHAVFYARDYENGLTVSRAVFSAITVLVISSVEYLCIYWDKPVFNPPALFVSQSAGGFLGSTVAYLLTKALGPIGLIILSTALIAIYISFFFMGGNNAMSKTANSFFSKIRGGFSKVGKKLSDMREKSKARKEERLEKEHILKSNELMEDNFFENGGASLHIDSLGVKEDNAPVLESPVDESSAPSREEAKLSEQPHAVSQKTRRTVNMDYGIEDVTEEEPKSQPRPVSRIVSNERASTVKMDEAADSVFAREFDPFDFATSEKYAIKPAASSVKRSPGISEYTAPLSTITEEDVERLTREKAELERKAEFERKKKAILESYSASAAGVQPRVETMPVEPAPQPVEEIKPVESAPVPVEELNESNAVPEAENAIFSLESVESDNAENAAADISAAVEKTVVGYTRSANRSYTYTTVSLPEEKDETEFKPYSVVDIAETESTDSVAEEEPLRVERTMLSPTVETGSLDSDRADVAQTAESTVDTVYGVKEESEELAWTPAEDNGTASVFDFGEADDEENDESDDAKEIFGLAESEDEESGEITEIPPEEQNPDILKQRQLFPFLDDEDDNNGADLTVSDADDLTDADEEQSEDYSEESAEDEPPFDIPAPKQVSLPQTALVSKESAAKEKKKKAEYKNFVFPPIDLLGLDSSSQDDNAQAEIQENVDRLIDTLSSFNVTAAIKGVDRGPRITRYEVVPAKGVKVSSIMNLQDDIALNLAADGIRMEAPIPGKSAVGVEIPNKHETTVRLRELLETDDFRSMKSKTTICIGKDVAGQPVINDIAKMPHLLIAGATGMGKSVCINALLISILYKARPDEVKLIMIDPKQVEFTMYNGIPHLLIPVVSDAKQAAGALMWAVDEMEKRFTQLNSACVRNIDGYNEKVAEDPSIGEPMSKIIIVIDEFADLMLQVKDPVENLVMRIAQKARAAGIHLIVGTQRPSTNVITGTIKANIPSRISCKVASNVDSRTVLDAVGAEKLLNKGDMLFAYAGAIKPLRVQGAFVSDGEVQNIMNHLKQFSTGESYDETVMEEIKRAADRCSKKGSGGDDERDTSEGGGEGYLNDRQFLEAVEVAVNSGKISTSLLQRKISIGYGKAAKYIDVMYDMGIVGDQNGSKARDVLITADEWAEKLARTMYD